VPAPLARRPPSPAPFPVLPAPAQRLPTGSAAVVLDTARLDNSGRLHARPLLDSLGWPAGHRVDIDVVADALLVTASPAGRHLVGQHGGLTQPTSLRRLCGITVDRSVSLAGYPALDVIVIHPAATVARLLATWHGRLAGADHAD
jgi:hypothetical protein